MLLGKNARMKHIEGLSLFRPELGHMRTTERTSRRWHALELWNDMCVTTQSLGDITIVSKKTLWSPPKLPQLTEGNLIACFTYLIDDKVCLGLTSLVRVKRSRVISLFAENEPSKQYERNMALIREVHGVPILSYVLEDDPIAREQQMRRALFEAVQELSL